MKRMKHEAVAKDLAKRAIKLIAKGTNINEVEVTINMCSHYIRLVENNVEFWSAEKLFSLPVSSTEEQLYEAFLKDMDNSVSKEYLIEYSVQGERKSK